MAYGTPYFVGSTGDSTSETQVIDVSVATKAGDAIVVATGSSATAATVTGIVDSASNVYAAAVPAVVADEEGQVWIAAYGSGGPGTATVALTTSATITVTYGSVSGEKACVALGITGLSAGGGAVDSASTSNKGSGSTAVSVTSGTLTFAAEVAVAVIFNAQGGGSPTSVTGGWNAISGAQFQAGTSPYVTCYYQDTAATTALSLGATLVSTTWSAFVIPLRAPVYLANSLEGGTNGTTISTANSGGNSGNSFDVVSIGASATLEFSSTEAAHGSLSAQFVNPASAVANIFEWAASLTSSSLSQVWVRAYVYLPSLPASTSIRLIRWLGAASAFLGSININSAGKVLTLNSAGSTITTSTLTVPTGAWFRLEAFLIGSATVGQIQVKIFTTSMDDVTPDETDTTAANINTDTTVTTVTFGNPSSLTSYTFYLDDLGASDSSYLGPSLLSSTSAIAGTAVLAGLGDKTGAGLSSLAGTAALTDLGSKHALAADTLSTTGLLTGSGAKRGTGPSLVTATGALAAAFTIPVPSAISATAALAGTGLKTGKGISGISATASLKGVPPPHPPVPAAFTTGYPRSRWDAGSPQTRWQGGYPLLRWPAGQ